MKHFARRRMPDLRLLYYFELKKIIGRKMVWITVGLMLLLILAANVSGPLIKSASVDEKGDITYKSGYEEAMEIKEDAKKISGRIIDEDLLAEMKMAYGEEDGRSMKEKMEDHQTYREIYDYVINYTGYEKALEIDEEKLYQIRQDTIAEENLYWELDEGEISYWSAKEDKVKKPFIYEYKEGASLFFARINLLSYLIIALTAICLASFFGEEHARRTDQIVLCSQHGKLPVYLARIAAGITFGMGGAVLFYLVQLLVILAIYGTGGFRAALQLYLWMSSWDVSIGGAILILFFVSLAAALVCSVITMFLSELFRNGVAVLATILAATLFTMFVDVPLRYGLISRVYDLAPARLLNETAFLNKRLFCILGKQLTGLHMAPVFYLALAVILIGIGYRVYKGYQVDN